MFKLNEWMRMNKNPLLQKAGDACDQVSSWTQPLSASVPEKPCVFIQSARGEEEEWEACVTPALSLYNFRPHFPQRPLNLTAIWWFAALTIHSWVKINLWDASLGQGFEDAFGTTCAWLCAGYDNLLWFILSADDTPRIICHRSMVRVYNIIQLKFEGEAKIENQPHEEVQTRNNLFDGYIFRQCNDGVSLECFKSYPHLWFGVGWLHTWLAHCVLLHKTQKT